MSRLLQSALAQGEGRCLRRRTDVPPMHSSWAEVIPSSRLLQWAHTQPMPA